MSEPENELTERDIKLLENSSPHKLRLIAKYAAGLAEAVDEDERQRPADVPDDAGVAYDEEESVIYWEWEDDGEVRRRFKEPIPVWTDTYPPR